jgi:hypothetical protein
MTDYYENLCPFCENNLLLSYFCEDCTSVFCEECVHFALTDEMACAACGSKEVSLVNLAALECKECRSKHIVTVQKQVKTCPSCSSSHVTKIVDKFDILRNRFKNIITGSKQFLSPLVYAVDTICIQKEKLIRLREDSVKICHHPRLEMDLLQLIKLFKEGKHAIQSKTSDFFQHINRSFKTYFEIEKSPPRLIPVLEAELEDFEKSAESIITFGNSTNEKLEERFTDIRTKIEFMSSLQRLFMRYLSILGNNLDYNEKPVFGIRAKLGDSNQPDGDYFAKPGYILLTNRKIYFLQEKGLFNRKTHLSLALRLDELTRVRVRGIILKKLILEFGSAKITFQLPKKNLAQLENYIEQARVFDNNKIDGEMLYGLKHVDISIQEFRNALESAIISLLAYKTALLDDSDPFGLEHLSYYSEMEQEYNPGTQSPYTQSQHFPPHSHQQNNFQNYPPQHYSRPPVYYEDHHENQQDDKINLLRSIYQKRPPLKSVERSPPPPPPKYHQKGTISNPYNAPGIPQTSNNPKYTNGSSYSATQSRFPMKSPTESIINKVLSVLPDESPYIPRPPEVQQSQNIPEIDVSTLVPARDYPEKLLRLEEQSSWLQRKIDILQKRRDQGKISEEDFLRLYEDSFRELYRTQNYIKNIKQQYTS